MTDALRPLIAGNWKMNGLKGSTAEFDAMLNGAADVAGKADLLVCPPATLIAAFADKARTKKVAVGAQDCHPKASGAHTGDISAEMLADAGATAIIVGHSERRADHGEGDSLIRQKAEAAWRAGVTAIVCIGETQGQRDAGQTLDILRGQLDGSLPDASTGSAGRRPNVGVSQTMMESFVWKGPEVLSFGKNWSSWHFIDVWVPPMRPDHVRLPRAGQRVTPQLFVAQVIRSPWLPDVAAPSVKYG